VRAPRLLVVIWLCFLARGLFYCVALPLWEGFDEYSHFAHVQHVARGELLIRPETRITLEVERSMYLAPMPWTQRDIPPVHDTYESYYRLPPEERATRERELRSLKPSPADAVNPTRAETQQPPLSYWLMAVIYKMIEGTSLPVRVFVLRLFNLLLTSAAIPAAWFAARRVLPAAAPLVTASVALFPELMFDGARVSNSALSIALYSALAVLTLYTLDGDRTAPLWAGVALGLGLLTKGFFLSFVPVFVVLVAFPVAQAVRPAMPRFLGAFFALAIPGWWYIHNIAVTGAFSTAIQDSVLRHMPLTERLRHIPDVHWLAALDSTFFSHIWFGGWSFLQVRAWIYHAFAVITVIAIIGLVRVWSRELAALTVIYVLFCGGIAYHVLMTYLVNGISSSAGWYLAAVIVPEMILLAAGLRALHPRAALTLPIAFAALDLYGMLFVALPYYNGLIAHRPTGTLESFHIGQFARLPLGPAGYLYLAATVALLAIALIARTPPLPPKHTSAA
jgi:4-amino-4-deoxy-L-arabinose transferase-like glycosyltransferase